MLFNYDNTSIEVSSIHVHTCIIYVNTRGPINADTYIIFANYTADRDQRDVGLVLLVPPTRAGVPEPVADSAHLRILTQHIGCRACGKGQRLWTVSLRYTYIIYIQH